ncbi:MAG: hypothetical protein ACRDS1_04085 [Pseudonocardiaceae bacterium]
MSWYLRSAADRDTHHGQLRDGRVHALCGAQFPPTITLPGLPPDGGQVCVTCYRETLRDRRNE